MGYVVRMPKMGMSMDQGTVVEWVASEGDAVEAEAVIAVVESEKAASDVEAREAGVLRRTLVPEGGVVEPGDPIGIVAGADEDLAPYEAEIDVDLDVADAEGSAAASAGPAETGAGGGSATAATDESSVRATPGARQRAREEGVTLAAVEASGPQGTVIEDDVTAYLDAGSEVRATPGARRRAEREGVDVAAVEPSGPQGTVIEDDVAAYLDSADAGGVRGAASRTVREARELSANQRTIADRLGQSHREAIHVTLDREIDAGAIQRVAAAAKDAGVAGSFTDVLLAGVSDALAAHPAVNALFEDDEHRLIEEVNVGVALDVDGSLFTPVVPTVDARSIESINAVRTEQAEAVHAGEHTVDDLSGGTFTVTNLGPFGVDRFDPVINPPQVGILGVGRVRDDGTTTLSFAFDHRVLNGASAARFLDTLAERLQDADGLAARFDADLNVGGAASATATASAASDAASTVASSDEAPDDPREITVETAEGYGGRFRTAFGEVAFDEPEDAGGAGSAPSPVDHLLGALGSCLSLSVRAMAARDDVPIGEITADVLGSPEEGPLSAVEVDLRLDTDAEDSALDRVVTKAERACYVHRALSEDLSVTVGWSRR